ncbi:hypothetical protein [Glutamicibacter sp. FBE19]|uniref:hypothetical protein n=1 Tax=Glutamicibacter sp. FBE19 TaxID=2761534 RepID=UPI0018964746|nr:hypothetical protein [Glutamicibacter sp. FBE19]MBF6671605.1 hypothetical protein [Glutamicibacter sp. FBE19]
MDGDKVEIYAGDRSTEWKQFTGVIDTTSGDIGGGIESRIIDNIDKLSAVVDIPALMTGMPPLTEGGAWRRCGMSSRFTQNTALRTAGFHSTPAPEWDCVLDVPMQGSTWPLRGTLVSGTKRSDTASAPPAYGSIWGSAIGDWTANYTPSVARPSTTPVQITLMRTDAHADFGIVRVEYGSSAKSVALQLSSVNSAQALVNGTVVATVACTGNAIATVLYKNGTVTIKTSAGATQTVSAPTGATGNVTQIVTAGGVNARCAGMQVSHPTDTGKEFTSLSFVPSAYIATGQMHTGNLVLPAVPGVPAREILEDIGAATLRPLWIDEYGKAVITGSDTLYTKFSVQTVTTLDDIRELSWERNLLSVRSEIRTKYLKPTVNSRTTPSVEAWSQNESVVLQSGESQEVVIEPGADEDWIMPDAGFEVLGTGGITNINKGATSVTAGVLTDGATESWATQTVPPALTVTVTQEAANRFVVKHVAGTLPAGNQVELRTVSENFVGTTALWPYWWGKQMPRLTAYAVVRWDEALRTPTVAGTRGPVLELDCGPWLSSGGTDTTAIDALSSFVATQVTNPQPTIKEMRVGYDPRRQLGDVITVSSPNFMGVELRCLIVGISNSGGSSGYEQSLTVRVISATTTYTTYQQFVNAWGNSATYSNFLAAWDSISTYADFNQNPLRGTA